MAVLTRPISNFPDRYSLPKRWFYQLLNFVGNRRLNFSEKALKKRDRKKVKKLMRKGDLLIVGNLKVASSLLMKGPLTHAMMYTGKGKFYHAIGHGVEKISLGKVFKIYDTCVLLRPNYPDKKGAARSVKFIKAQKGKPYNFDTEGKGDSYYCTQLAQEALGAGGVIVELGSENRSVLNWSFVDPMDFLGVGFDTVFVSHNLKVEGGVARLG